VHLAKIIIWKNEQMWYCNAISYVRLLWFNKNHKFKKENHYLINILVKTQHINATAKISPFTSMYRRRQLRIFRTHSHNQRLYRA